jgi:protein associated with RNAse G/E
MAALTPPVGQSIRVRKLDYVSRQPVYSWQGTVIAADAESVVVRARFALAPGREPPVVDGVPFETGDIFTEFYYPHRWYNVFHVADAAGRTKGWYCNVAEPATCDEAGIAFVDLCLDLFVHPDGSMAILDEDEFAEAIACAHGPDDAATARAALEQLIELARSRALPGGDLAGGHPGTDPPPHLPPLASLDAG